MDSNPTTAQEIAEQLGNEPNVELIEQIVMVLGMERTIPFLLQTMEVETKGGLLIRNGERRRTPGGVFFHLVRGGVKGKERNKLWPLNTKVASAAAQPAKVPMTWEEAKALVSQAIKTPGEAKTVKVTLIGRPLKVIAQKDCVVVSLKGKPSKSLPNGLPPVPEGSAITWAVFIVNKQWAKVKASIEANENDALIIEGYPIVGKNGVAAVMANNCKSVLMERAQREQPSAG